MIVILFARVSNKNTFVELHMYLNYNIIYTIA